MQDRRLPLDFIIETAMAYPVDKILHVGDLVNISKDKVRSTFIADMIRHLRCDIPMVICPGNHDCPNHRVDKVMEGRLAALFAALPNLTLEIPEGVEMLHTFVWHPDDRPSDKIPGESADDILARTKAPLVLTGDNHQSFIFEQEGRYLINPGSMMRTTVAQIDFRPKIFIWDDGKIKTIKLPIAQGVISKEHIEAAKEVDDRMEKYMTHLESAERLVLDFRTNMKTYLGDNKESDEVMELIWEAVEG